jgi:hypothetical protein
MLAGIASKAMKDKAAAVHTDSSSQHHTTINSTTSKHEVGLSKNKIECPFNLDEIF